MVVSDLLRDAGFQTEVMWIGCTEADMLVWHESIGKSQCLKIQLKSSHVHGPKHSERFVFGNNGDYQKQFVIFCGFLSKTETVFCTRKQVSSVHKQSLNVSLTKFIDQSSNESNLVRMINTEIKDECSIYTADYHQVMNSYHQLKNTHLRIGLSAKLWCKQLFSQKLSPFQVCQCDFHMAVSDLFVAHSRVKVISASITGRIYRILTQKRQGRSKQSWVQGDFDFLAVVLDSDGNKLLYVIPASVLSSYEILRSCDCDGKLAFYLDPYEQTKSKYRSLNQYLIPESQFDNPKVWEFLKQEYFNPDLTHRMVRSYPPISSLFL